MNIFTIVLLVFLNFIGWLMLLEKDFILDMTNGENKIVSFLLKFGFLLFPTLTLVIIIVIGLIQHICDLISNNFINNVKDIFKGGNK